MKANDASLLYQWIDPKGMNVSFKFVVYFDSTPADLQALVKTFKKTENLNLKHA